tara:strand:- start:1180 stop:1698 length:519 start_codon:yes stop_codon:yes gene_type:complete
MFLYVLTLLALIFNALVGYYVSYKRNVKEGERVYDLGFKILPNLEKYDHLGDYALIIPSLFIIFSWNSWGKSKKQSFLTMLMLMYMFRALSNYVTTLPASKECKLKPPFGFCNDYMFSGHAAFNITTSYHIGSPLWPVWPILTSIFSVASREHYSVDHVIAWLIFAALKCKI